jgi:hypothetical protein
MLIEHFQFKEVRSKDYFRKAWSFSFVSHGQSIRGVYHQNGTIDWKENGYTGPEKKKR